MTRFRSSSTGSGLQTFTLTGAGVIDADNGMYYPGTPTNYDASKTTEFETNRETREMTDVEIPNFKERQKNGEIFQNPKTTKKVTLIEPEIPFVHAYARTVCAYQRSDWSEHYTNWQERSFSGSTTFSDLLVGAPTDCQAFLPADDGDTDDLADIAISKSWANIGQFDILALAALAESGKTVSDLISIMKQVKKLFYALNKKRALRALGSGSVRKLSPAKRAKRLLSIYSDLEDLYMNARYNLRPLYYDICGVMKIIENDLKPNRHTFRGYSDDNTEQERSAVYSPSHYPVNSATFKLKVDLKTSTNLSASAGCLCSLEDASIWSRMGINAIPETMWELVPFSFVIDWFANVGETILAWTPKYNSSVLTSWVTVKKTVVQSQKLSVSNVVSQPPVSPWAFPQCWDTTSATMPDITRFCITDEVQRIPNPSRPILPSINVNLDSLKILDLAVICKNILWNKNSIL